MKIRTYFWDDRVLSRLKGFRLKLMGRDMNSYFRSGNAGDILTGDIIEWKYNKAYKNIKK